MRLTGRRWYEFLEDEDLIEVGRDPARFPIAVRDRYLKEVAMEGVEIVPEEHAIVEMRAYINSREQRDVARAIKYVEKLAGDYSLLFGTPALEKVVHGVVFTAEQVTRI